MKEPVSVFIRNQIQKETGKSWVKFSETNKISFIDLQYLSWAIPKSNPSFAVYKSLFDYGSGIQELERFCSEQETDKKLVKELFFRNLRYKKARARKLAIRETLGEKKKYLGDGVVLAYYKVYKYFTPEQVEKFEMLKKKINVFFISQVAVKQNYKRSFCRCHLIARFVRNYGDKTGVSESTISQFESVLSDTCNQRCQ
jgi:hypothetical protein